MKLITENKNEFITALEALIKEYSEEYQGTITADIKEIVIPQSKANDWAAFCKRSYRLGEEEDCNEWVDNFEENNPLEKILATSLNYIERHESVDMIKQLKNTLLNRLPKEYAMPENWQEDFNGIEDILENPSKYPENLINDLDSVIEQFYAYHPLFKWDW
jgi:hypothetical protein